jgi:hypothetical protein
MDETDLKSYVVTAGLGAGRVSLNWALPVGHKAANANERLGQLAKRSAVGRHIHRYRATGSWRQGTAACGNCVGSRCRTIAAPAHVVVAPFGVATTSPAGSVSVNASPPVLSPGVPSAAETTRQHLAKDATADADRHPGSSEAPR